MDTKNQNDYATKFQSTFKLKAASTALLIIDMQYASASRNMGLGSLLKKGNQEEIGRWRFERIEKTVIPNIKKLLDYFRRNGLPVIFITLGSEKGDFSDMPLHALPLARATQNYLGSKTHEILEDLYPLEGEIVINKTTFSAFASSEIDRILKKMDIAYVLCCGVSTNTCVESTARDAADYGYRCLIVEDACSAAAKKYHQASLENFARLFGRVSSTDEVIEELGN